MAVPLEIQLMAVKPTVIVGEEPVLAIQHRVFADLDMETVALNRSRTTILVERIGASTVRLTGQDHIQYQKIHPLTEIGSSFQAKAGSEWTDALHLFLYRPPLEAGRYRIGLEYQYADGASVAANSVELNVLPAVHLSNAYRWLGGSDAFDTLSNLWRAESDGSIRWVYQTAGKKDPAAVRTAVDLTMPAEVNQFEPVLTHINGIASFQYERYAVWAEPGHAGWVAISQEGRIREPRRCPHGLRGARVAEPPLQHPDGAVSVVLFGEGRAVLIQVPANGEPSRIEIPLEGRAPDFGVTAWHENGTSILYWGRRGETRVFATPLRVPTRLAAITLPGRLEGLAIAEWLGKGQVTAVIAGSEDRKLARIPILATPEVSVSHVGSIEGSLSDIAGDAVLVRLPEGWRVGETLVEVPPDLEHPHLVSTPKGGPWLVGFHRQRGFEAIRLAEPEPQPLI